MNISQLRKTVFDEVRALYKIVDKKTYNALIQRYYLINDSKIKLNKFRDTLKEFNPETNTKQKLKVVKIKIKEDHKKIQEQKNRFDKVLRSHTKVLQFNVRFYKQLDTDYKGTEKIVYNDVEWVPLTKNYNLNKQCSEFQAKGFINELRPYEFVSFSGLSLGKEATKKKGLL